MENPETAQFCAECGIKLEPFKKTDSSPTAPLQTAREALAIGSTLGGQYKVMEELGKGVLGNVYKAIDETLNREVVVKLIKPEIAQSKETLERLSNELKTARKIVHKNVARMLDLNQEKGTPYITMEYVPGQNLKELIKQMGRLTIDKAVSVAAQVCAGLAEAHRLGVTHQNLKPENIMIDKEDNAMIMDFGIARPLYAKAIRDAGITVGTPEYMSPEQAELKYVDQRSDVYSLGIILYEMVTGRVPFEGDDALAICEKQKLETPKDPRELNSKISEEFSRLILKCLEKDIEKRYQTAEELRSDLEKIETKKAPLAKPVKPAIHERKFIPENLPILEKIKSKTDIKKYFIPALAIMFIVILGSIIWRFLIQPSKGAAPAPPMSEGQSVAVLPFEDISPTKNHEYLGDGIAETLINALTPIQGLRVPARASSFSFKGKKQDKLEIGRKLGVDYLIEATIAVVENNLKITARLMQVKDGAPVWSNQYDRTMDDVFAIQDEIAREIVKTLKVKLPFEKEAALIENFTRNLEAYNVYLRACFLRNKTGKENLEKAVESFQRAIEKDPTFVLAYSEMAKVYAVLGRDSIWPPNDAFPKAKTAILKALQLDPNLADGHALMAIVKEIYEWDLASAEKEYKEAIRINPNSVTAHQWYGAFLSTLGRHEEAVAEIKLARTLDPLSPRINAEVGGLLYFARQYDLALEELKKGLELDASYFGSYYYLGMVYVQMGQHEEAVKSFLRAAELGGQPVELSLRVAYVYALLGQRQEVGKLLTEALRASSQTYVPQVTIATVYAALGEKDQVFACLDKALTEHDAWLVFLKVYPMFDHVRLDPFLRNTLRKIGLEK